MQPLSETTPGRTAAVPREQGPSGIGTAVAFDWGLTAQFVVMTSMVLLGARTGGGQPLAPGTRTLEAVGTLLVAALFLALGESVRRGRHLAWQLQIGFNVLLIPVGYFELFQSAPGIAHGHLWSLPSLLILLFVDPLIVWLLTRRRTRAWVATISSEAAAARHGGAWMLWIALFAAIGGTLVALGMYF